MTDARSDAAGLWQDAADAVVVGLRRTLDYQRTVADDYRDRFLTGGAGSKASGPADWSGVSSGMVDYATSWVGLTLGYYKDLAEVAGRFAQDAFPAYAPAGSATAYGPGGRPTERATIEVRGPVGQEIRARFTVENSDDRPAEVFVEAGRCRGEDGSGFMAPLTLKPNAAVVEPHGAISVNIGLELDPTWFEAGNRYRLPISLHGPQPAIIELEITVEDTVEDRGEDAGSTATLRVRCPVCERIFERKTESLVLRPHNDQDGQPCANRDGVRAR